MKKWKCNDYTKQLVRKRIRQEYEHMKCTKTLDDLDYYYGRASGQLGAFFVIAEAISYGIYDVYTDFFLHLYIEKKKEIEGR